MATCKDCLHYELCQYNAYQEAHYFGKDKKIYITIKNNSACKFFKPTADVAEVKHGEWAFETDEEMPNPMFKLVVCSVCNSKANGTYHYCPHCGAKMKGSEKQ